MAASPQNPEPAYPAHNRNAVYGDEELYKRIGEIASDKNQKSLISEFEIPIRSGRAWVVKKGKLQRIKTSVGTLPSSFALFLHTLFSISFSYELGQLCTLSTPHGPQVGDLNIWSLHNPRERFWASRTRQLHASHVSVGDRLWSCLPYMRPLVTIVGDSLKDYGVDEVGGRVHDLLGTRFVSPLLTSPSLSFGLSWCHG